MIWFERAVFRGALTVSLWTGGKDMDGMNKGNLIEGLQEGTNLASAGTGSIDAQSTGVGSGMMPGNGKK